MENREEVEKIVQEVVKFDVNFLVRGCFIKPFLFNYLECKALRAQYTVLGYHYIKNISWLPLYQEHIYLFQVLLQ